MSDVSESTPESSFWLENLSNDVSRFSSALGDFRLDGNGYVGSVQQVDRKLQFDPYIRRAIANKKLKQLTEGEALLRMETLEIKEERDGGDALMESLSKGASERTGRYRKDLPDEAESRRSITAEEVLSGNHAASATKRVSRTVQRSEDAEDVPEMPGVFDRPILDPSAVLTDRVREGDWESQTGL